jgi:lambda repressor-like predicted transcriptional regulator
MNRKWKIAIPIVAGILALGTGLGVVAAKSTDNSAVYQPAANYQTAGTNTALDNTTGLWYCNGVGAMMGYGPGLPVNQQVAALLDMTPAELNAQLSSGKTLAEIASANGVSQEQLMQTLMVRYQEHLRLMEQCGNLTQEQASSLTEQVRERLQTMLNTRLSNDGSGWNYMGGEMGRYYGGDSSEQQPGGDTSPQRGYGGMMGGYGGGMMGNR